MHATPAHQLLPFPHPSFAPLLSPWSYMTQISLPLTHMYSQTWRSFVPKHFSVCSLRTSSSCHITTEKFSKLGNLASIWCYYLIQNPYSTLSRRPHNLVHSRFAFCSLRSEVQLPGSPHLGQSLSLIRFTAMTSFKRMGSYLIRCSMRVCLMLSHNYTQILHFLIRTAWEWFCALARGS